MTTTAETKSKQEFDNAARAYILAMKQGKKPQERPDVGTFWDEMVEILERNYTRFRGDPASMAGVIETMCKEFPALADLLKPNTSPLQGEELGFPALPESAYLPPELARGACPELDTYIAYGKQASPEGYDDFHPFCGLWGFSAVPARRVYLELEDHRFYTNLMIVLCARTTLVAKTETANVAKKMLYHAGLDHLLLGDRITPQKMLSDMAGIYVPASYADMEPEKQRRVEQRLSMPGQRAWHYDEFGKFVQAMLRKGSSMADFAELFLKFDQCPPHYTNATIVRDMEPIEKPYLTLLGTMTPANIKESAKRGAEFWGDGFWARFSFICPPPEFFRTQTWKIGALPFPQELISALRNWHDRLGVPRAYITEIPDKKGEPSGRFKIERENLPECRCSISEDAWNAYDRYRTALRAMTATAKNHDLDGNYGRLPETAMRMAVIMASLSNNNRIELRHWAKAQELAEILRRNLHELYAQVNISGTIESVKYTIEEEVIKHLSRHGALTLNTLRHSYMKKWSVKEVEEALRGLKRSGMVVEFTTSQSVKYKLVDES
jgi:hypothetical protein